MTQVSAFQSNKSAPRVNVRVHPLAFVLHRLTDRLEVGSLSARLPSGETIEARAELIMLYEPEVGRLCMPDITQELTYYGSKGKDVTVSSMETGYWSGKFMQARRVEGI